LAYLLQTLRCAAPLGYSKMKPKGKPQRGVILIELMRSLECGGAAHRNIKWYYWKLHFSGDN